MIINIDRNGDLTKLKETILATESEVSVRSVMILATETLSLNPGNFDNFLKGLSKPVFGGVFPQVLTELESISTGFIVAGLTQEVSTLILENISEESTDFDQEFALPFQGKPVVDKTTFIFVDGMSKTIAPLLDATFNYFGLQSNYIGGGAGSANFTPIPCVITPKGILQDAALFAFADTISGVGVAHGWHPVSQAMKITESSYNSVQSIDWKPASEVYLDFIGNQEGEEGKSQLFEEIARSYPLGIVKVADELLVRDPIQTMNKSMICLGELPVNSFVYVLKGDAESLLAGTAKSRSIAENVFRETKSMVPGKQNTVTFFIDCITRAQFLGDKFTEELRIAAGDTRLIGALSLGEIANSGHDYLEFYNKTSVVGIFEG